MKILGLIAVAIFIFIWTYVIKKYLPKEMSEGDNKKFDERESEILLEVFSNTLIWIVYALLLGIILKMFNLAHPEKMILPNYPEVGYLIFIIIIFLMNLLYTKNKYSAKG